MLLPPFNQLFDFWFLVSYLRNTSEAHLSHDCKVFCWRWQLSIMVISVRGWYWFPRGLLLNPGFVCLSWCFDLLRLAFTVDFHSNSCVNNHRILTASIKGNLEMFCLGEFCSTVFPILLFLVHLLKGRLHLANNTLNAFDVYWISCIFFIFFQISWFWKKKRNNIFNFSLVI